MKRFILAVLVLSIGIGSTQVGYTTEYVHKEELQTRASPMSALFENYPPKIYKGMTLIKVEKISGGYRGWYV